MKVYSVQDIKGKTFMNPIIYRNQVEASRAFETATKDANSQFNKFPEDFLLMEIGEWDSDNGILIPNDTPQAVCLASDFIQ